MGLLSQEERPGRSQSVVINGERFSNTAAKFWTALIDEVREESPESETLELSAPSSRRLNSSQLDPRIEFGEDLEVLLSSELSDFMKDAVSEFEMFGPPASVRLKALKGEEELLAMNLPSDVADEDIFSFLVVWLLKWAGVDSDTWNNEYLSGEFEAEDSFHNRKYLFSFSLVSKHLSEGLYQREVQLSLK